MCIIENLEESGYEATSKGQINICAEVYGLTLMLDVRIIKVGAV